MTIGATNASYIVQMVTILDQTWINQFQVKLLFGDQKMIKDDKTSQLEMRRLPKIARARDPREKGAIQRWPWWERFIKFTEEKKYKRLNPFDVNIQVKS